MDQRTSGDADDTEADDPDRTSSASGLSRVRSPLGKVFSLRAFLLLLGLSLVGLILGGAVPVVGGIARYVGLFLAAFLVGLVRQRRAYLETIAAGALAGGATFVLGTLGNGFLLARLDAFAEYGVGIAGVGVGTGLLVALAGHYFGRDLRAGLKRDVE